MKSYAVEAFVLRLRPLGEADRILTLFTRERGKLSAVAKGSRKTQSKFGARLDFFARSLLTLHAGRSLDIITSASLVAGSWERLVDPDTYAFASYVAEVIDTMCEPEMPLSDLYELLVELQDSLGDAGVNAHGLRAVFDLRALSVLGFGLELDACARCGTALGRRPFAGGRAALSPEAGGLVCRQCLDSGASGDGEVRRDLHVVRISGGEFELLKTARDLPFADVAELPELAPLARVTEAFMQHHLGRASRALGAARGKVKIRDREAGARR